MWSSTMVKSYAYGEEFLASLFRIYFWELPLINVAPVLGATLAVVLTHARVKYDKKDVAVEGVTGSLYL